VAPVDRTISVVIPTLGRDSLRGCLDSIAAGARWPAELIVVDQSGGSRVAAWVAEADRRGLAVKHVPSDRRGIAAATNLGFRCAGTPLVATTHDDCRVAHEWLETIGRRLSAMHDAILTGRVVPEGPGRVLTVVTSSEPAVFSDPQISRTVLFPANMAFDLALLSKVGYLDEHPSLRFAGEDNDWAYRALRSGVRIEYDPDVVVAHLAWQSQRDVRRTYRRYARGQGSFYGKHVRNGDGFIARRAARDLIRAPWLLIRGVLTLNADLIAMATGELLGLVPGILSGLGNDGRYVRHASVGHP
jgi:GT2 family glycosyltransferase